MPEENRSAVRVVRYVHASNYIEVVASHDDEVVIRSCPDTDGCEFTSISFPVDRVRQIAAWMIESAQEVETRQRGGVAL